MSPIVQHLLITRSGALFCHSIPCLNEGTAHGFSLLISSIVLTIFGLDRDIEFNSRIVIFL